MEILTTDIQGAVYLNMLHNGTTLLYKGCVVSSIYGSGDNYHVAYNVLDADGINTHEVTVSNMPRWTLLTISQIQS